MLSLNATSLLDAAISWERGHNHQDPEEPDENEAAEGYYSLPVNLNETLQESDENLHRLHHQAMKKSVLKSNNHNSMDNSTRIVTENSTLTEKLSHLSIAQLNELYMELEQIIQLRSEVLITELALRDELEYEKELKNRFISLLLSVQNKRRYFATKRGGGSQVHHKAKVSRRNSTHETIAGGGSGGRLRAVRLPNLSALGSSLRESLRSVANSTTGVGATTSASTPVYLTTVIPYRSGMSPLDVATLQMLIKCKSLDSVCL